MKIFKKFEKTTECYKIGKSIYSILEIHIGIKKDKIEYYSQGAHYLNIKKFNNKKKIECLIFIMKTLFFLTNYPNFVVNKHIIFPKIYKYIIRLRKVCVPLSENSRIRAILYLLLLFWIMKIMY